MEGFFFLFLPAQTCLFRVPRHDRLSVGGSDTFQAHTDICMNEKLQKKKEKLIDLVWKALGVLLGNYKQKCQSSTATQFYLTIFAFS